MGELACSRAVGGVVVNGVAEDVHDGVGKLLSVVGRGRELPILRQGLQLKKRTE